MPIDRTDPADEPDNSHVDRRAQAAPDNLNAADTQRGAKSGGDGLPDSSRVLADPGLRAELSKVTFHGNGHVYLDLKDDRACISGVIWIAVVLL